MRSPKLYHPVHIYKDAKKIMCCLKFPSIWVDYSDTYIYITARHPYKKNQCENRVCYKINSKIRPWKCTIRARPVLYTFYIANDFIDKSVIFFMCSWECSSHFAIYNIVNIEINYWDFSLNIVNINKTKIPDTILKMFDQTW